MPRADAASDHAETSPTEADFQHPNETLISFQDSHTDEFGQRRFFAFWIAHNIGPHLNEHGVRGQVFFTNIDTFIARASQEGPVRIFADPAT
ncbi:MULTISPECIES: hypothetical protein [Mycolicibacter]|uniref:Uncharacterized protein n=1 Tax=Mycolicibacter longobardus TaxID=1108812 RepID=A0A1X1YBM5_9MYCO|nr:MULTISPECIES: hypothetical protein [Mycolicibacter]ORW08479.1 hypothetical protein AWC16_18945 [Mycolicibacter longobardus]RAV04412.1 hypothetical protein DQP56_00925 [Mycolicibacter senuensis]